MFYQWLYWMSEVHGLCDWDGLINQANHIDIDYYYSSQMIRMANNY